MFIFEINISNKQYIFGSKELKTSLIFDCFILIEADKTQKQIKIIL